MNGTWYFRTKGDANFGVDPWILPQGYIVGQVVDINPPLTLLDWNLLLWLTSVVAFGTGAFGSVIILLTRREKESDSSSTPT